MQCLQYMEDSFVQHKQADTGLSNQKLTFSNHSLLRMLHVSLFIHGIDFLKNMPMRTPKSTFQCSFVSTKFKKLGIYGVKNPWFCPRVWKASKFSLSMSSCDHL